RRQFVHRKRPRRPPAAIAPWAGVADGFPRGPYAGRRGREAADRHRNRGRARADDPRPPRGCDRRRWRSSHRGSLLAAPPWHSRKSALRPLPDSSAKADDVDRAIGDLPLDVFVVKNADQRRAGALALADAIDHHGAVVSIEGSRGLIEQQHWMHRHETATDV